MIDLAAVLRLNATERIGVGWRNGTPNMRVATILASQMPTAMGAFEAADAWFAPNPTRAEGKDRRGAANEVTRLAVLPIDLDAKPGGCGDMATCGIVIHDLGAILGTPPVLTIHSGHGMQPMWVIDPNDPDAAINGPDDTARLGALVKRWGLLVAKVAAGHGARVDNVFNLDRLHRVPGSLNRKNPDEPVKVTAHTNDDARVLSVAALVAACNREGIAGVPVAADAPPVAVGDWGWGETTDYVASMIDGWAGDLPGAGRHQWLLSQAVRLACAHRLGRINATDHENAVAALSARFRWMLTHLPPTRDEAPREIVDALRHGHAVAAAKTDADCDRELGSVSATAEWEAGLNPPHADELFDAHPLLAHLRDAARAARVSPAALMGVFLTRMACEIGPHVQLPGLVGGPASLNTFVGLCGTSSSGKSATVAASDALWAWTRPPQPLGSGEGLTHAFVKRTTGGQEQHTVAVFALVDEIDQLTAMAARQGATLLSVLRTAWTGGAFGFGYADPTKRLTLAAHTYRLGVLLGIQPARAQALLDDTDAGTPQRFLWLPVADPGAPDTRPDPPGPLNLELPRELLRPSARPRMLDVCDTARNEIDAARLAALRGGVNEYGHSQLAQLKVAAVLAVCDGRAGVADEDWDIAARIIELSDSTREWVQAQLSRAAEQANLARARSEAARAIHLADETETETIRRARNAILRHSLRHETEHGCTRKCLRQGLSSGARTNFDPALEALLAEGLLVLSNGHYRGGEGAK